MFWGGMKGMSRVKQNFGCFILRKDIEKKMQTHEQHCIDKLIYCVESCVTIIIHGPYVMYTGQVYLYYINNNNLHLCNIIRK